MMPNAAPPLQGFDHLHVYVADRPAAAAWYERVLGLRPVAALAHWAAGGGPLVIGNGSGTLHLALFERARQANRAMLAVAVDAAQWQPWRQHLAAQRVEASFEDHGESWSLYFDDPDGNPYEITCYDVAALRGGSHQAMHHCADQ
jgi:catechol 2,3-dioxygenase-like lactoylglutathione lyase family enzyme